ncbi:G patch domain-containing protein 4, partial [Stegodyphus mimosarum]
MNEFGRKQLEKYGWTKGKGLGKEENGITKPIKSKLKFDTHGIGHDSSKVWMSRWWCDAFNEASSRIQVIKNETGVSITSDNGQLKSTPLLTISSAAGMHGKFVKAETMNESKELPILSSNQDELASSQVRHDDYLYRKCEALKKG